MHIFHSFRKTITVGMLAVAIFATLLVGGMWIAQEYFRFERTSVLLKEEYLQDQRDLIKGEVDRVLQYVAHKRTLTESRLQASLQERVQEAIAVAANIYAKHRGKASDDEITGLIVDALRPIRFNYGRGYYFIYRTDGTNVMLPFSPELEGTNMLQMQDGKGDYLVQRTRKIILEKGKGFLTWFWYRPEDKLQMQKKIGFVQAFAPLDWWIGTGEYVEDFEKLVQQEALAWINSIRYGKDGYIFVYDYQANTLAHYKKENIGLNQWEFRDAHNKAVLQELIGIAKKDKGEYLDYVGTIRPSTGLPEEKIAYARGVQDWRWMIGTGVYVNSINVQLETMRDDLFKKIQRNILLICLVLFVCILFIAVLSRFLGRKIVIDLVVFTRFFRNAARSGRKIRTDDVYFHELQGVAEAANNMIDERNLAEAELQKVQGQLLQSRKMEALGLLAGGVAHDLNNVLSGMIGYPDLILHDLPADSRHRVFLQKIKESGQKAANIVEDLLTLARRGVAQRQLLDLNEQVELYLQSPEHGRTFEKISNIAVETKLEPALLKIRGSQVHIQKTIMNLMNNAVEAQADGGQILISTANIYVDKPFTGYQRIEQGEYVVLTVSDKGTGIASEDLDRIFEPFFTKKKLGRSGTGLGMAVVWGTMQDHEGFVNVQTREGEGTTFELYFPATRDNIMAGVERPARSEYFGQGEHILIVDDIAEQRDLAGTILQSLGYKTTVVSSGYEAVSFLKDHHADLVLLDMIMEDQKMDGLETYKQIKKLRPQQRALIASGFAETDRVRAALQLGVSQYVKKPYTVREIGVTVRSVLDSEKQMNR